MKKCAFFLVFIGMLSCGNEKPETSFRAPEKENLPLVGQEIPSMELDAWHNGAVTKIRLSDYRGKWLILFFYPADFTFVCPTELREMSEYYDRFRNEGAEVLSVSTDSVFVHKAWQKHDEAVKKVRYPMLSDRSGKLSRALRVYDPLRGVSVRGTFLVDPKGFIVACEFHDETIGRSAAELFRKLEAIKAVRENEGDFCPAAWKPGDAMIHGK